MAQSAESCVSVLQLKKVCVACVFWGEECVQSDTPVAYLWCALFRLRGWSSCMAGVQILSVAARHTWVEFWIWTPFITGLYWTVCLWLQTVGSLLCIYSQSRFSQQHLCEIKSKQLLWRLCLYYSWWSGPRADQQVTRDGFTVMIIKQCNLLAMHLLNYTEVNDR